MKIRVITRHIADLASKVESVVRQGRVEVVALGCNGCGRWVNPSDWNPRYAVCEACAVHAMKAGGPIPTKHWRAPSPARLVKG